MGVLEGKQSPRGAQLKANQGCLTPCTACETPICLCPSDICRAQLETKKYFTTTEEKAETLVFEGQRLHTQFSVSLAAVQPAEPPSWSSACLAGGLVSSRGKTSMRTGLEHGLEAGMDADVAPSELSLYPLHRYRMFLSPQVSSW